MKVLLAVVATALVCAPTAFTVGQAVTPKQFNALSKRVSRLEKDDRAVIGYIGGCFSTWAPMARYTNYLALDHSDGLAFETTAVDLTDSGDQPGFYVPTSSNNCTLSASQRGLLSHRDPDFKPRQR